MMTPFGKLVFGAVVGLAFGASLSLIAPQPRMMGPWSQPAARVTPTATPKLVQL